MLVEWEDKLSAYDVRIAELKKILLSLDDDEVKRAERRKWLDLEISEG